MSKRSIKMEARRKRLIADQRTTRFERNLMDLDMRQMDCQMKLFSLITRQSSPACSMTGPLLLKK